MVVKQQDHHRKKRYGLRRARTENDDAEVEEGLIPLSVKTYTFSYEAAGLKSPEKTPKQIYVSSPKPTSAVEFGTAFEFSPEYPIGDETPLKQKKKKRTDIHDDVLAEDDEEIPTHYQSIFTYESMFRDDPKIPDSLEEEPESLFGNGTYICLVLLSALFLLITFPIAALFCIKRLSKTKKLIIFRLGRLLKPRGPGCTVTLPFVDEYHVIDLAEQSLSIKPLTAATSDSGQVEVGCQVVFLIVEPEAVVTYWSRDPHDLIMKKAQSALAAAVSRIQWNDVISGRGSPDIASDGSLNSYCSPVGIQILEVKLTQVKSIQDPPKISDPVRKIDFKKLGQQIASLSPFLVGGGAGGIPASDVQRASAQFAPLITQIATLKANSQISALNPLAESMEQVSQAEVDQLVERALSRSQIFLNNDRTRAVLGSASLQVFVYASDIQQEGDHLAAFYMDADKGKSERGILETEKPSATVHIKAAHLAETLEGRFDLLEAMKMSQIRFSGSLLALSKLRFLLQFK
ncbi:hypothetical protein Aperf_G00000000101 [Anoplocephala perfoliata]